MKTDDLYYLSYFNRFANYLEKNNSLLRIKIANNHIWYCDNYQSNNSLYKLWCLFYFHSLKDEINVFFFGTKTIMSFFECFYRHDNLLKLFGKPSCLEELAMKMDLMGI